MSEVKKHTPGPWVWTMRLGSKETNLIHPHRGWLVVMDFVRLGMTSAQPRFAVWKDDEERQRHMGGIMTKASELELHKHPDALLIAAAPDLLAACKELLDLADCDPREVGGVEKLVKDRARAALAKAEGRDV
jgi:hypothetical protein